MEMMQLPKKILSFGDPKDLFAELPSTVDPGSGAAASLAKLSGASAGASDPWNSWQNAKLLAERESQKAQKKAS